MEKTPSGKNIRKIQFGGLSVIAAILLFLSPSGATGKELVSKPVLRLVQSAIVPGFGQFSNGKYIKSAVFLSFAGGMLYGTFKSYGTVQKAYETYEDYFSKNGPEGSEPLYDEYVNKYFLHQYLISGVLLFWLYNAFDAFFDAHYLEVSVKSERGLLKMYLEKKF